MPELNNRQNRTPADLRRANAKEVLRVLRDSGPLRISDISDRTGISRPTVTQLVASLEADALVEYVDDRTAGTEGPRLGRPARLVRFRAETGYVLGAEVGPSRLLLVVMDMAGTIVTVREARPASARGMDDLVTELQSETEALLAAAEIEHGMVRRLVVGVPGLVDHRNRTLAQGSRLVQWNSDSHCTRLRERFGFPVFFENDVNLAVIGESRRGAARGLGTVAYVHWGTRVGAGILVSGRLHTGASSAAGEIGHMVLDSPHPSRARHSSDQGTFEQAVGAAAIAALGRAAARRPDGQALRALAGGDAASVRATTVFAAAQAGDPVARAIADDFITRFAVGLAPLILVLDPDIVVLGGGVVQGGTWVLDVLRQKLVSRTLLPPPLALSSLHNQAAAVGGACMALEAIESDLLPASSSQPENR
ncbi:ROK family transcriptional regulator [Streptomyces olivaceoviridis]|uniref:ROK family transcriptional regulator n=1 Tax=Streptomyces olivaceoviridis TaxID=1921 RepID=UPI0036FA6AE1